MRTKVLHTAHTALNAARTSRLAVIVLICMILVSCERPFVPPLEPTIRILSPGDPSALRLNASVEIRVEASSFREIERIELSGKPMTFDESAGNWYSVITLQPGVNELDITAFDVEDFPGNRKLFLSHVNPSYEQDAPTLPAPWRLGGHTATLLNDGSVLVTGGAPGAFQNAVSASFLLSPGADAFVRLEAQLNVPRYGHSATLLPDGRVLILGGALSSAATNVSQLSPGAEIYDPATRQFLTVTFEDSEFQGMEHTAFISEGPRSLIIDIYGGLGTSNQGGDALVIRDDIQTFGLFGEELASLSNFVDNQIQPAYGMSSTLLNESSGQEMGRFLVSGTTFLESGATNINFSIDFDQTPIRVTILDALLTPRIQHASATLEPGLVAIFGGFQGAAQNATSSTEVFDEINNRFSTIDSRVSTRRRFAHTATKLPSNRILILGGFSETGSAIAEAEYFDWGL